MQQEMNQVLSSNDPGERISIDRPSAKLLKNTEQDRLQTSDRHNRQNDN